MPLNKKFPASGKNRQNKTCQFGNTTYGQVFLYYSLRIFSDRTDASLTLPWYRSHSVQLQ